MNLKKDYFAYGPFSVLFLVLGSFALYSSSLYFDFFLLDDSYHITDNEHIELTWKNFIYYWKNSDIPVAFNAWQLVGFLFGYDSPVPFRMANIILHIINGVFLFKILDKILSKTGLGKESLIPFLIAFFFLFHPMQVESVVWISSQKGTLASFFMLWSLLVYLKNTEKNSIINDVWIITLCVLGVLSKPVIGVVPLIFLCLDLFWLKLGKRAFSKIYTIVPFIGLLFYFFTVVIHKFSTNIAIGLSQKIFVSLDAFGFYIRKFFFPFTTNSVYGASLEGVVDSLQNSWFVGALIVMAMGVLALVYQAHKKNNWLFLSGFGIFFLFYLPTSGLISYHYQIISTVADRYMYLPSIGLALITIDFWIRFSSVLSNYLSEKKLKTLPYLFILLMLVTTGRQINIWESDLRYLDVASKANQNSFHIQLALGLQNMENGHFSLAEKQLKRARVLNPNSSEPNILLMRNYSGTQELEKAKALFESTKESGVYELPLTISYIDVLTSSGKYYEAVTLLKELLRLNPYNEELKFMMISLEAINDSRHIYSLQRFIEEDSDKLDAKTIKVLKDRLEALKLKTSQKGN